MRIQSQIDQVLALAEKATPDWRARKHGVIVGGPFRQFTGGQAQNQLASFCVMHADDDITCQQDTNTELAVAAVNFLREHGPAIRAAVGGEAVAWVPADEMEFSSDYMHAYKIVRGSKEDYVPLYASPTATVDVGALRTCLQEFEYLADRRDLPNEDRNRWATIKKELAALIGKEA